MRFAAGRIVSKRDELEILRRRAYIADLNLEQYPHDTQCRIAHAQAAQALADFLDANPQLASAA